MKEEKALWKRGSAYFPSMFIPVVPVVPVVGLHSEFDSRVGLSEPGDDVVISRLDRPAFAARHSRRTQVCETTVKHSGGRPEREAGGER